MDAPPLLSPKELAFFAREGYLIRRGCLSPELCALARDRVWACDTAGRMRREDPSSWVGPFAKQEPFTPESSATGGHGAREWLEGHRWAVQFIGAEGLMLDLLPRRCMALAEQLVGPCVQPVADDDGEEEAGASSIERRKERYVQGMMQGREGGGALSAGLHCRGVVCALPEGEGGVRKALGAHLDAVICSLGCVGLVDDVPEDGGAYAIWPRSHKRLFYTYPTQFSAGHPPAFSGTRTNRA